jgi:hypothetical protein
MNNRLKSDHVVGKSSYGTMLLGTENKLKNAASITRNLWRSMRCKTQAGPPFNPV